MRGLYVEQRVLNGEPSISWDIAHHLYARQLRGTVVVVTEKPHNLQAAVSKQWQKLTRQVQRERSRTLNAVLLAELTRQIKYMQMIRFVAQAPDSTPYGDIFFASFERLLSAPSTCHTLYITSRVEEDQLAQLTRSMREHSLIVLYE